MEQSEFDRRYLAGFNAQQVEAVHSSGATLLLAVPGSGKTAVLVAHVGYLALCCGAAPENILAMTYTVAATNQLRRRVAERFGGEIAQKIACRTINGVSQRIIDFYTRAHGSGQAFALMDREGELNAVVREIYRDVRGDFAAPGTVRDIRTAITYAKNMLLTPEEIDAWDNGIDGFPDIFERYQAALRARRCMDFDDQMVYAKTILERYPDVLAHVRAQYPYLCVDEAQDTSKIQHAIIRLIAEGGRELFLVGDEDQSIYGFRAAYPEALLSFERDHPGGRVLLMEENYRSTPEILRAAEAFVCRNRDRRPKALRANRGPGSTVRVIRASGRAAQYEWLREAAARGENAAVLYRNNDSALPLIDRLDRAGTAYACRRMDDTFFTSRIVADIADILAFAANGCDAEIFLRIYYKFGAGISKKAAEAACAAGCAEGQTILDALLRLPDLPPFARQSAERLRTQLALLPEDPAERAVRRVWDEMRYGVYAAAQGLDGNRLAILLELARREKDAAGLLARLAQLRALVAEARTPDGAALRLSTIHSAKGLEYGTVYILDALGGILPADDAPRAKAERDRYEEERRLFYVAMTRAKDELYLFDCAGESSPFVDEVLRELPQEDFSPDDLLAPMAADALGRRYAHKTCGEGTVTAACGDEYLITYADGSAQRLTLGELYAARAVTWKKADVRPAKRPAIAQEKPADIPEDEAARLAARAEPGGRAEHARFGAGTIVSVQPPLVEIAFSDAGTKKFVLADAIRRGLLRLDMEKKR